MCLRDYIKGTRFPVRFVCFIFYVNVKILMDDGVFIWLIGRHGYEHQPVASDNSQQLTRVVHNYRNIMNVSLQCWNKPASKLT